jgi:6-pyruvoyltetrahydropterin/6-carboxytetrahydropterin synthase
MEIFVTFHFDAAHRLHQLPEDHKCSKLHGHTFKVEIHVSDQIDSNKNWVIDFADIKKVCAPVIDQLDHSYLNDIQGLENPTSEMIAKWLWEKIYPSLPILTKLIVQESPESGAICTGE